MERRGQPWALEILNFHQRERERGREREMMTDSTLHTERQRRLRKWGGGMFQNKVSFYCFMLFFGLEAGAVRQ